MLRHPSVRSHALAAFVPAVLFYLIGGRFLHDSTHGAWYNLTVDMYNGVMTWGAIAYVAVGVACLALLVDALAADAIITLICAGVFALCGIEWTRHGYSNGHLNLLFAVIFFLAGRMQFVDWRRLRRGATQTDPQQQPAEPPAAHPASIHPESLPTADQPPPAEGYLAALAKDKRDAPRADIH